VKRAGLALSAGLLIAVSASPARATTKKECARAYEQTQSLRSEGELAAARDEALVCSREDCPRVVRADCATWLAEIERSLPTVVLVVRDEAGEEIADVRVLEGEAVLRERLDGKAMPLDPGPHVLRFERPGSSPVERRVMVHEGDKLVRVEASFGAEGASATAPGAEGAAKGGGAPVGAYVLGGVGIVGASVAVTLGILALNERASLRETCAPGCAEGDVDRVRTKLVAADVVGGVSLGAIAAGVILLVAAPSERSAKTSAAMRFEIGPTPGGAFLGVRGAF
jgi:hypothetical protein